MNKLILVLALCCSGAYAGDYEDGRAAYTKGDRAEAVKLWKLSAENGNAEAQHNLGLLYHVGQGVTQNYAEAVKWYRLAAAQGNADAQIMVSAMYYSGEGVTQNYAEAMKWYRLSAAQGNADAQNGLGLMYYKGQGVTEDRAEAVKLWKLSAAQGNALAQNILGVFERDERDARIAYNKFMEQQRSGTNCTTTPTGSGGFRTYCQ